MSTTRKILFAIGNKIDEHTSVRALGKYASTINSFMDTLIDTPTGMHLLGHLGVLSFQVAHIWLEINEYVGIGTTTSRANTYAQTVDMLTLGYCIFNLTLHATNSKAWVGYQQLARTRTNPLEANPELPSHVVTLGSGAIASGMLMAAYTTHYPLASMGIFSGIMCFDYAARELAKGLDYFQKKSLVNGNQQASAINGHKSNNGYNR